MPGTEDEIHEAVSVREDAEREREEMRAEVVALNSGVGELTACARKDAQMVEEAVLLAARVIKLLKIRKAARDVQDELRTAAEDLKSSYPREPGLPRFGHGKYRCWRRSFGFSIRTMSFRRRS